ncbi:MAG: STAS domain-containing protein [Vulcanimicrobiaceae bacterium]
MFSIEDLPDSVVLHVIGSLDCSLIPAFERALEIAEAPPEKPIVLSLHHCTYMDSTVAGVVSRHRRAPGVRLRIEDEALMQRLLFCGRCMHGISAHGIAGCRLPGCRCVASRVRLLAPSSRRTAALAVPAGAME